MLNSKFFIKNYSDGMIVMRMGAARIMHAINIVESTLSSKTLDIVDRPTTTFQGHGTRKVNSVFICMASVNISASGSISVYGIYDYNTQTGGETLHPGGIINAIAVWCV